MLRTLQKVSRLVFQSGFFFFLVLSSVAIAEVPIAQSQEQDSVPASGTISGTVRLKNTDRPASQVAVTLRSRPAAISRGFLTDTEGHFAVQGLPLGAYELLVDEPGYEPAQTTVQLDGSSSDAVLYLVAPTPPRPAPNKYSVSVHELSIPGNARHEYQKGLLDLQNQEFAHSVSHFTAAARQFPQYYEAFYNVGVAQTRQGHVDEAMLAFQKAVDLTSGKFVRAQFGIGYAQYLQGHSEEAIVTVQRALEADQNAPEGYLILSMAQLRLDRLDDAERSAREALLRNPNLAEAYLVLSDIYGRRREYSSQLHGLSAYLKLQPDSAKSQSARRARDAVQNLIAKALTEH